MLVEESWQENHLQGAALARPPVCLGTLLLSRSSQTKLLHGLVTLMTMVLAILWVDACAYAERMVSSACDSDAYQCAKFLIIFYQF